MRKFIATHESLAGRFGNAYIIPDHCSHSIKTFLALVTEARRDFPELRDVDIECRTVVESAWCRGCPIIHFAVKADLVREGWVNVETLPDVQLY